MLSDWMMGSQFGKKPSKLRNTKPKRPDKKTRHNDIKRKKFARKRNHAK